MFTCRLLHLCSQQQHRQLLQRNLGSPNGLVPSVAQRIGCLESLVETAPDLVLLQSRVVAPADSGVCLENGAARTVQKETRWSVLHQPWTWTKSPEDEPWANLTHAQLKAELQSTDVILRQLKDKDAPKAVEELTARQASLRKALRDKMPDGQRVQHLVAALKKQEKYSESRRSLLEELQSQLAEAKDQLAASEEKEQELQKELSALKSQIASDTVPDTPAPSSVTPTQIDMAMTVSCQDLQKQLLTSPKPEDLASVVQQAMQSFVSRLFPDLLPNAADKALADAPTQVATEVELQQAGAAAKALPTDHYGACDKLPGEPVGPYAKAGAQAKPKGVAPP